MAEKARLFHDHRALELILCSLDPQSHKRIGRIVRSFDHAIWERECENSVLAGIFDRFLQNPATKRHLFDTGCNILAEAGLFDPIWGLDLWADDPDAHDPRLWRGKNLLGQALSTVRDLLRRSTDGRHTPSPLLLNFALRPRRREFTRLTPRHYRASCFGMRLPRSSFGVFDPFF